MKHSRILHINITDFMAAVEQARDAGLKGRPFVVGWEKAQRGVVLSASERAFREGIRHGMALSGARRAIPSLQVISPDYDTYRKVDERLKEITERFSPIVEARGGGHLYIDLSGTERLFGPSEDCALRIRKEIHSGSDLVPALGLASGKVVSKVGTRVARPGGFVAVPPGKERSFLEPRDISILPGVGPKILARLRILRINTIGDLALLPEEDAAVIGPYGVLLRDRARGIDPSAVRGEVSSFQEVSAGHSFAEDINEPVSLERVLLSLVHDLGYRIRSEGFTAGGVRLHLMYTDGVRSTGARTFSSPASFDEELISPARSLLKTLLSRRVRVRSLRCELIHLIPDERQLDLFLPPDTLKNRSLQESIDRIHARFGKDGLKPCAVLTGFKRG
ncbi:MAG TPA: hypothetical protein PLG79_03140 [Spirochaetales bacterium]|nr:hypothetical protein [Spirochaetales bacterium]